MKAREILRRLVRRFGLLVLLTLIGGGAGAAYAATKTPTYTAKAYVVAVSTVGDSIGALNFAQAYGRVATSGPVLVKAAARLGGDRTGLDQVTASTSPDAPVIEITTTGPSAAHTADVANAVARSLAEYGTDRKVDTHVDLTLLAAALIPDRPSSPKPPLELLVGAAAGLLIGGLAVLAGVGRAETPVPQTQPDAEERPVAYTVEVAPEPHEPAEIEGHLGVWRALYGPKAITAYRSSAAASTTSVRPRDGAEQPDRDRAGQPDRTVAEQPDRTVAEQPDRTVAEGTAPDPQGARPLNGTVYSRPIVGRAAVAGMDDEEDD